MRFHQLPGIGAAACCAAVIALAASPLLAPGAAADIADRLSEPAPEIDCSKWAAGEPVRISKLRGRVVILHLSDPERITSQAAVPPLRKLAKAWKDQPVSIVEVVLAPMEATALTYAAKELPDWPVGIDAKGSTAGRYPGTSVPRTYLIGPDGRIVWHAHVQALTKDLVQGQVDRVQFFTPGPDVKKAKGVAKAAAEQRYGPALAEAARVEADQQATDADRAICKALREDVARTWELEKKLFDAQCKDLDWGLAWRRAERMVSLFKGTDMEDAAKAEVAKLEEKPIVGYVRPAQDRYDDLLADVSKARSRKDLETALRKAQQFAVEFETIKPGERARDLVSQLEKRLAEMTGK